LDDINKHISLIIHDENDAISGYFVPAIDFIREALAFEMNVLVHCKTGNGLSAAILTAYLVFRFKIQWKEAYEIIKQRRGTV
jgi:protein-tyrosine phosphatase